MVKMTRSFCHMMSIEFRYVVENSSWQAVASFQRLQISITWLDKDITETYYL